MSSANVYGGGGADEHDRDDTSPPPKKRSKSGGDKDEIAQKKSKACTHCRRAKLRCVIDPDAVACRRCIGRKEESTCKFKVPLHDEQWQENTVERLDSLTNSVNYLVKAVEAISKHLNLPLEGVPPPLIDPSPQAASAGTSNQQFSDTSALLSAVNATIAAPSVRVDSSPNLHPLMPLPSTSEAPAPVAPVPRHVSHLATSRSSSLPRTRPPSRSNNSAAGRRAPVIDGSFDYSTLEGAEQLLAQAYANWSPPFPTSGLPVDAAQIVSAPAPAQSQSVFGLLDFGGLQGAGSPEASSSKQTSKMADRLLAGTNRTAVGCQDPRTDVVKSGLIPSADTEVLVDFFHAHLAQHMFGFPLRLHSWPYLPAGKSTITPVILTAISIVSAERIPRYQEMAKRVASSSLAEVVVSASPGLSFAATQDLNPTPGSEPDLDLELGIGPEEISGLLIYATFSGSPRSDIIARTAFEWTFMLPSPPPVTYGEVFGLLPARRELTLPNWFRLWLFGFIIDAQQSLHHERAAPIFDPTYFCDSLLMHSATKAEEQADRELVAHARICALLLRIVWVRGSPGWAASSAEEMILAQEQWNTDIDNWWIEQNLDPATLTHSASLSLTLFKLFARCYFNLVASKETKLSDDPTRWRFRSRAVKAAYDMLMFVADDGNGSSLNLLLPFYVKMVTLSAFVLLDALNVSVFVMLPCSPEQTIDLLNRIASNLSQSPMGKDLAPHLGSASIRKAVARAESELRGGTGSGSGSGGVQVKSN